MKHGPHALINVQALSEPQRAKHRRKVYSCYKAGMTKYAAAKKCRIQETTVGRWYRRFDAAGEEAVHGGKRGQGVACGQEAPSDGKSPESGLVAHLSARKNEPESVRRLFHKKEVRYAAD